MSDKITYMNTIQTLNPQTGETTLISRETNMKVVGEPNFVKIYFDCLLSFKELSKTLNPILLEFLKHMSYASPDNSDGGQLIYVNAQMKKNISLACDLKVDRINQALTSFVNTGIFKRVGTGTYQVNPHLFGKGHWNDIKNIRAKFDFKSGEIEVEIEKNEDINKKAL